jgi:hypothetical protein
MSTDASHPLSIEARCEEVPGRWLWTVKWLLAVPHLLIVGVLIGSISRFGPTSPAVFTGGLLGVLVPVAGVHLAVLRRYPTDLFGLVVGLNRWAFRVLVYLALMTDVYPPFRLDQGGREPAPVPLAGEETPAAYAHVS